MAARLREEIQNVGYATLEILVERVRNDLQRNLDTKPARLRQALHSLLDLLVTAESPADLTELATNGHSIRGLRTHLTALERHLQDNSQLPEALCPLQVPPS